MPVPEHVDTARRVRFEGLFSAVYEPVQRYVARRVEAAAVDDVVAETLLVAWRRLDDVPPGAELAWCYGTARRCLANTRRAEARRGRLSRRIAAEPEPGEPSAAEPDEALAAALAGLSTDDREIVRLWAWEGLQPREIAVALAITPNAASIRLHRAKQRLAALLAPGKDAAAAGHKQVDDHIGHGKEGA